MELIQHNGSTGTDRVTLKQRIMRRIYFLYLVRNAAPFAFDCFFIVLLGFIATFFVSIRDVLSNLSAASTGGSISGFSLTAFSDTEFETKILLVVLGAVGFLAVRDLKRAWRAVCAVRVVRQNRGGREGQNR